MKRFAAPVLVFILLFMVVARAWAQPVASPWQQLQESVEKVTGILIRITDDSRQDVNEQIQLLCDAIYERFDLAKAARLCLGNHWHQRTDAEKSEFIALFGRYLESFYLPWTDRYNGEQVIFVREKVDGSRALVHVQALYGVLRVPMTVRLHLGENGQWMVYDVAALGVSLVGNLRAQFTHIIHHHSYEQVIGIMEEKTDGFTGCGHSLP
ncbi:MAG: ABC transporter substrate-binding protein [Desulfobacteraceae bacterium]|nr:ABC transporter substrate-binding protein [Desulfobacteraceae bacterium]